MFSKSVLFFLILSAISIVIATVFSLIAGAFTFTSWIATLMGLLNLAVARGLEFGVGEKI